MSDVTKVKEDSGHYQELDDIFATGNPRPRSKPGTAPGEINYEKIRDKATGRIISKKPANEAYLTYQRWKESEVEKERRIASGEVLPVTLSPPWTFWMLIRYIMLSIAAIMIIGNFALESPVWGYEKEIVSTWRRAFPHKMQVFTPNELAQYNGEDLGKPIYIGIDGDVFDVTRSRRMYGPGGAYHVFAGKDAARAFVTGCFSTHLTHDLRGFTDDEYKVLLNWKTFFERHDQYNRVGTVKNEPIDPNVPIPKPCKPPVNGGANGEIPLATMSEHPGRTRGGEL